MADLDDELAGESAGAVTRPVGVPRKAEPPKAGLFGRELPHSVEAEEYLLSCCFIDGAETMAKCAQEGLMPEAFYVPQNQKIFARLGAMAQAGLPLDLDVLAEELKKDGKLEEIGGLAYLMQVSAKVPTTAQSGYFIERVKSLHTLRRMITTAGGIVERAFQPGEDVAELLESVDRDFQQVVGAAKGKEKFTARPWSAEHFGYPASASPNTLLGMEDWLERGGAGVWVAPTGTGKTSSILDACMEWCRGRDWMGIPSRGEWKILVVQSEDSDRYLGKVRGSFVAAHALSAEEDAKIAKNMIVVRIKGLCGKPFVDEVERQCKLHAPDILVINPLYLFLHGSVSDDVATREFCNWIDAMNYKLGDKMGIIVVHHTGKPPKPEKGAPEKAHMDSAYAGIGSSFWSNWFRFSMELQPRLDEGRYVLVLGKGGKNAGVVREYQIPQGAGFVTVREFVTRINIRHTKREMEIDGQPRPMIVWEADDEEGGEADSQGQGDGEESKLGRKSGHDEAAVISYFPASNTAGDGNSNIKRAAEEGDGLSHTSYNRYRDDFLRRSLITRAERGFKRTAAGDDLAKRRPGWQTEKGI